MSQLVEATPKSHPRISEWTGMRAMMASIIGLGFLQLTTVFKPELTLPFAVATLAAYAVGLVGLWRPLNSTN